MEPDPYQRIEDKKVIIEKLSELPLKSRHICSEKEGDPIMPAPSRYLDQFQAAVQY